MAVNDPPSVPPQPPAFRPPPNDPWLHDAPDAREVLADVAALLGNELAVMKPAELRGGDQTDRLRVLRAAEVYHQFWNWCTEQPAPAAALHAMDLHRDFAGQVLHTYFEWGGDGAPPEAEMRTLYELAAQCCD